VDPKLQRETLDLAEKLNRQRMAIDGDPETASRIAAYEMAFRLQTSAPELLDFSDESKTTLEEYGCDPKQPTFARGCLMARRMIERGVRMVTIYNEGWDAHSDVVGNHKGNAAKTDRACAALIRDLRARGLLEDTLVIWGGEFGRTPMVESNPSLGRTQGRDHHPQAFSMWMAGGGVKAGMTHGATDDLGFHVVDNPVDVFDLQATILHLLGFDHERLTFSHAGRDFRLTDIHGHVVRDILA
jgi:arylsulfatase A-like enzyme